MATPSLRPLRAGTAQRRPPRTGGFTLLELMVVLCIASILMVQAVRFTSASFTSMRLAAGTNSFLAHLAQARSEAIKRNGHVAVCKSDDGERCTTVGGWEQGWIAFHDADNSGARESGEPLLVRSGALPVGLRFSGNSSVAHYVSFSGSGGTHTTSGAFQAGTLTLCRLSAGATEARQIVINAVGRPRVQKVQLDRCE